MLLAVTRHVGCRVTASILRVAMKIFGDAVILCGGESRRMGFDKSQVEINGKYIIELVYERLSACFGNINLCADSVEKFRGSGLKVAYKVFADIKASANGERIGPVAAIHSALSHASTKYVFVIACDMPLLIPEHIEFMKDVIIGCEAAPGALVPIRDNHIEPLYSFYSIDILKIFEQEIEKGNYKINNIIRKCSPYYLSESDSRMFDKELAMFTNINYAKELEELLC